MTKARNATKELIAAKKFALGIDGDPDTRAAFWLKVTEAQRRLAAAKQEAESSSKVANEAIQGLEDLATGMDPDSPIVLITGL